MYKILKQNGGFTPASERVLSKQERKAFDARLVRGFTMIELLVAISVFTVIITITSGIFISSLRSNRTSVALIAANSDAQLTLDQMARMVRKGVGSTFLADSAVGKGSLDEPGLKCLKFKYGNDYITYRWNKAKLSLEWNVGTNGAWADCSDSSEDVFSGIISENLRVDFANFRVDKSTSTDYPKVTILLRVGAKNTQISSDKMPFTNLQITISPRNDIRY